MSKRVNEYITYNFKDDLLWEAFKDDFTSVTEEDFKATSPNALRLLRSHLRTYGVWVQWDRKASVA